MEILRVVVINKTDVKNFHLLLLILVYMLKIQEARKFNKDIKK